MRQTEISKYWTIDLTTISVIAEYQFEMVLLAKQLEYHMRMRIGDSI